MRRVYKVRFSGEYVITLDEEFIANAIKDAHLLGVETDLELLEHIAVERLVNHTLPVQSNAFYGDPLAAAVTVEEDDDWKFEVSYLGPEVPNL